MILQELLDEYLLTLRNRETLRSYSSILGRLVRFLGPDRDIASVRARDILAWQKALLDQDRRYTDHPRHPEQDGGLAPMTVYKNLVTVRGFWQYAVTMEYIDCSPMRGLSIRQPPCPSAFEKAAPLTTLRALLPVAEQRPRDRAMYLFLLDTGCRAGAVCRLQIDRLDLTNRRAWVTEKRGRQHKAVFGEETAEALATWLDARPDMPAREVFLSRRTKRALTTRGLSAWLRALCAEAGVDPIGPHAIRHAVGCYLALEGEPLSLIRDLLGHEDARTTASFYMPDGEEALRAMVERSGLVRLLRQAD